MSRNIGNGLGVAILYLMAACSVPKQVSKPMAAGSTVLAATGLVTYLTGDSADINAPATPGFLLAGGSTDVDEAVKWFLKKSGGGDIVVLRASGADGYNPYFFNLVPVNSVETIMIDSRDKALLPEVAQKIRQAEALFIAGGDQANYVNFWKDTPVEDAINYLLNEKRVPVGGTSAGLAVLGASYFSAKEGTVVSADALADPYNKFVTVSSNDFLKTPFLSNTITDSHYTQRDRQGRHIAFMARLAIDGLTPVKGIGIDEKTAVCVDEFGIAKVFGANNAYFLFTTNTPPEVCKPAMPLTWNFSKQAVSAYRIAGSQTGNGVADLTSWLNFSGGIGYKYYVTNGSLLQQ